ncbi:MAG: hypothetical protein JO092_02780 [Candidatus Eremiobacteraeota bacterium]|nr:hypothetical protein [Candidatus Eremiobacteraeota bacterium]
MTLVIAAAFAPVAAGAQATSTSPTILHYRTSITEQYGSQYPVAGHLDLEIFSNGIVRGYYHNAFQKAFVPVTGGRDGTYLWFTIGPTLVDLGIFTGPNGKAHVIATMDNDNSFRGQIYPESTANSNINAATLPTGNSIGPPESTYPQAPTEDVLVPIQHYLFAGSLVDKSADDYPGW